MSSSGFPALAPPDVPLVKPPVSPVEPPVPPVVTPPVVPPPAGFELVAGEGRGAGTTAAWSDDQMATSWMAQGWVESVALRVTLVVPAGMGVQ